MLHANAKFVPGTSQSSQTHWAHLALPLLVASGVPPDEEGGILPYGRKAWTILRVVGVSATSVSNHFVRRAGCPALRQAGGQPLRGTAPGRILSQFDKNRAGRRNDFGGSNPVKFAAWVRLPVGACERYACLLRPRSTELDQRRCARACETKAGLPFPGVLSLRTLKRAKARAYSFPRASIDQGDSGSGE